VISLKHPEILQLLAELAYGLMPVYLPAEGRFALLVKASKEAILTASLNNGFKIYVLGDQQGELGLVTAFFDDPDEPIVLRSLLFHGDGLLTELTAFAAQTEFDVHIFDEQNRELLGARASNPRASSFHDRLTGGGYPTFDQDTFHGSLRRLDRRFSTRNDDDDAAAYEIHLGERLFPDDILILDMRDELYRFNGAWQTPAVSSLERSVPGPAQERDIAVVLGRAFEGHCIYLNPIRADAGTELTDILVVNDDAVLFVQAKDSPNTQEVLRRTLIRKSSATRAHVAKAADQLRGAISHARKSAVLRMRIGSDNIDLDISGKLLIGLVVVREMFDYDFQECSAPVIKVAQDLEVPTALLDYSGLHLLALHLGSPEGFLNALLDLFEVAMINGEYPRPMFSGRTAGRGGMLIR
jgi:hypothetical protein